MPPSKPQRQIDWEAVWKSLNWDDETRQRVADEERLRQRAHHYAAPAKEETVVPENARIALSFDLGSEKYAADVMVVRAIRTLGDIALVPGIPTFYRGVTNVRGQILSVLDLRTFFQIPYAEEITMPNEAVIVRSGKLEIALLAHHVNGVITIPPDSLKNVDHMPYTLGITTERLILLDIPQLFKDERLIVGGVKE